MATAANLEMLLGDSNSWDGVCQVDGLPIPLDGLLPVFTMDAPTRQVQKVLTRLSGVGAVRLGPFQHAETFDLDPGAHPYSVVLVDSFGNHVTVQYGKFNLIGHSNP